MTVVGKNESYAILHLLLVNQTVKANLKTFTLGLNEDCQHFANAKLYTISSKGVSLGIPSSFSNEKVPMVTPMNQGESQRRFQKKKNMEKCQRFERKLGTDTSAPVCNPIKMQFPSPPPAPEH